jgi:hypothetical protein
VLRKTIQQPYTICGRKVLMDAYALICNGVSVYVWRDALVWLCSVPIFDGEDMHTHDSQGLENHKLANKEGDDCIRSSQNMDNMLTGGNMFTEGDVHANIMDKNIANNGVHAKILDKKFVNNGVRGLDSRDTRPAKGKDEGVVDTRAHVVGDGDGVDVTWGSEIFGAKWQHLHGMIRACMSQFLRMSESECMGERETEQKHPDDQAQDQRTEKMAGNNKAPMQIVCVRFEVAAEWDALRMIEASPGVDLIALRKSRVWNDGGSAEESPYDRFGAWMG